jgi:hypothetical protein
MEVRNQESQIKLSYLAGIIDGEGCITIRRIINKTQSENYLLSVQIGMYDKEPIELIVSILGGSISKSGKLWKYYSYGDEALNILRELYPYLLVKKEEALIGIAFQTSLINRKGHTLSEDEIAYKRVCYEDMQACILSHKAGNDGR